MKPFALSLFACVAIGAMAIPAAPASGASTGTGTPRVKALKVVSSHGQSSDDSGSSSQKRKSSRKEDSATPDATQKSRVAEMKLLRRTLDEQRKAEAHEKAEVQARADDLYAASQTNAPIIDDAKACKRIGANGESIYENC